MSTNSSTYTETVPPVGMDGASDGWLKAFALCSVFSACLSIVGSSLILRRIFLQNRRSQGTLAGRTCCSSFRSLLSCAPYTHLMLGLSISDIFASFVYSFFNFLDPQETSPFSWAIGNQQTCDAVGFLSQLALTPLFYNAMLSVYYMLTIRFAVTETTFAKYWEPWLHLIVIGYPTSTAIYLLAAGYFEDVDNALSCWVNDPDLAWIFVGIPVVLIFVCIVANNLTIYCFVRRTIRQSARDHHAPGQTNLQSVATMAFLYVGTFLISYIWAYMTSIVEFYTEQYGSTPLRIALRLLYHIFHPLQGFWNLLVFCRPRYLRYRDHMEKRHQRQVKRLNSSDGQSTEFWSSDFSQDSSATPLVEYDRTITGALRWAVFGPEALPHGQRHRVSSATASSSNQGSSSSYHPFAAVNRTVLFLAESFLGSSLDLRRTPTIPTSASGGNGEQQGIQDLPEDLFSAIDEEVACMEEEDTEAVPRDEEEEEEVPVTNC